MTQSSISGHNGPVHLVCFSRDATYVASGGSDGLTILWNATAGICRKRLEAHRAPVTAIAFSPHNTYIASGSQDGEVKIWKVDGREGDTCLTWDAPSKVHALTFTSIGLLVLCETHPSPDKRPKEPTQTALELWNATRNERLHQFDTTPSPIHSAAFSGRGTFVTMIDDVGKLRQWDYSVLSKSTSPRVTANADLIPLPQTEGIPGPLKVFQDGWVFVGGRRVCWLPQSYRPFSRRSIAYFEGVLAIGAVSGQVVFLRFGRRDV